MMACKLNHPCPYEKDCTDCLYSARRNRKTGLDTSDMRAYKREYERERRRRVAQKTLLEEMRHAGVA